VAAKAGTGPKARTRPTTERRAFERLGLHTAADFVVHLPLRYEDETHVTPVARALPGQWGLFEGEITDSQSHYQPRRELQATLQDSTGCLSLRWLHVYPGQQARVSAVRRVRARGEVRAGYRGLEIIHPLLTEPDGALPDTLTPIYPTTQGLSQASLRKAISHALDEADLTDTLPPAIRAHYDLAEFAPSLRLLHHPTPDISLELLARHEHPAWRRIKFDEILAQQLALAQARSVRRAQRAWPLAADSPLVNRLLDSLPFSPTNASSGPLSKSGRTWLSRIPCTGCCKVTSAAARRWLRRWRRPRHWPQGCRWPSWHRPRSWPNNCGASFRNG
jgi:ATP-dependent DNA helicase RecG